MEQVRLLLLRVTQLLPTRQLRPLHRRLRLLHLVLRRHFQTTVRLSATPVTQVFRNFRTNISIVDSLKPVREPVDIIKRIETEFAVT